MRVSDKTATQLLKELTMLRQRVAHLEALEAERQRAGEALRASEERLRVLLETTKAIPWEASAKTWQFTYVGPQAVALLGYPPDKWLEKDFWVAHIHPEDREYAVEFCQKSSSRYQDYQFEYRMITADGRVLWIHDIVNVVSVDGEPETLRGFMIDITAWKQAEQALRESEAKYRVVADTATDAIISIGEDSRIIYANPATERIFGYPVHELVGQPLTRLMPDMLRSRYLASLSQYTVTGQRSIPWEGLTLTGLDRSGREIPLEISFGAFRQSNGAHVFTGIVRDISERKSVEEALRASERRLRQVLDIDPHFIFAKDREGRFTLVNQAVADAYGTTVEDLIGKTDADFNPNRNEVEFFRRIDREVMDTLQEKIIPEEVVTDAHGKIRWLQTVKRPIMTEVGIANEVLGSATDITERKQAEDALRQQTEYVRLLKKIAVASNEASLVEEAIQVCLDKVCSLTRWPVGHAYVNADDGTEELVTTKLWHLEDPELFEPFRRVTEQTRLKPGAGLPGRVLLSGSSESIIDVTKDLNFSRAKVAKDVGIRAGFAFPVLVGREVVAVMEFFSPNAAEPDERLLEVMEHVGTQLGRVVERKRLERGILEASEQEQRRIGQDLHDGLSQHLTGVAFLSKGLAQKLESMSRPEAADAAKIADLINQSIVQTRDLARGLYPVHLEATGLVAALQELASQVAEVFDISCRFWSDPQVLVHDNTKATHLYYVAREAVNNAIKHGKAQCVEIGLTRVKDRIILTVKDDGVGFPETVEWSRGMGLHTMRHRARMINAALVVQRSPGGGTIVTCVFHTDTVEKKRKGSHGR